METLLVLWLSTGAVIREPATQIDCSRMLAIARYVDASESTMTRDGEPGIIARVDCGGQTVVLALPATTLPCEVPAS